MNSAIDPDNLKELSLALRQGKLPLQDYIIQTLSYIEKREPVLGALLPEDNRQQRLLKQAEELLLRFPEPEMRPPLFGILIGVKDLINVDGYLRVRVQNFLQRFLQAKKRKLLPV